MNVVVILKKLPSLLRKNGKNHWNRMLFSYFLRQELGFVQGSAPGEGPGQLPEPPLRPSRVKVTSRVTAPSKINENRWKINENRSKPMKIDEKRWRSNDFRWKKTMKINENQWKSIKNHWKSTKTKEEEEKKKKKKKLPNSIYHNSRSTASAAVTGTSYQIPSTEYRILNN